MNRTALVVLLLAAGAPSRAQVISFEAALAPPGLARALTATLLPAAAVPVSQGVPAPGCAPLRPIPVFDRSALSSKVVAEVAKLRASLVADMEDAGMIRFPMPKTKVYADSIVAKLLAGSRLEALAGGASGLSVRLNDTSWGGPGASMSAGILTLEPEMIAIMSSEDEVAAVAAHEIVHYLRAHDEQLVASRPRNWNPFAGRGGDMFAAPTEPSRKEIKLRWSHEFEADALSLRLLVNAGYDPSAAISALLAIQNERNNEPRYEFDRGRPDPTHPPIEVRLKELRQVMAREHMVASTRASNGLPEVYRELAGRRRSPKPEDVPASELYQHYQRPKTFAP
ncbi:MAG: M48 family metalloprotease [Elusimicrobiota bacterium]